MKKLTSCFDNLSIANRLAVMYALVATVVLSVIVVVLYILETTEPAGNNDSRRRPLYFDSK